MQSVWKGSLVLICVLLFCDPVLGARIKLGSVPTPPVNDPYFKKCARNNVTPKRFETWGEKLEPVVNREDVQQHVRIDPTKEFRVTRIVTSTPLIFFDEEQQEMLTEYMYTYQIDGIQCGFKALYSRPTYVNNVLFEDGGLFYLEYLPQKQETED